MRSYIQICNPVTKQSQRVFCLSLHINAEKVAKAFLLYACLSITEQSLCVDLLTWFRGEKEEGVGLIPPSSLLPLGVFNFFLSRLSLHAQCHILIAHSSKLISDNARLMEAFPKRTLPLSCPSTPFLCVCLSSLQHNFTKERLIP